MTALAPDTLDTAGQTLAIMRLALRLGHLLRRARPWVEAGTRGSAPDLAADLLAEIDRELPETPALRGQPQRRGIYTSPPPKENP